jgi:eukaryotic-like serine/threonine-protein kinase
VNGNVVGQRYRMARMIGAGGMGSVHEATDTVTGTRVAVKLITAEMAKNATLMGRFEREARAAATIDTPHIVKVLDAGTDDESTLPFLAMEFLEGEDVQQLIKRLGPLPPDLALRIVAQACIGLDRAHEARIIHRDIKPANFFLAKTGSGQRVVKLLDFGIAKIAHDPESNTETAGLTRTGSMLGSPLYMSPEQARGHKDLDRRADVWSMGVVLYQALTGRTPHQDTDALGELIIAICTEEAAPIQELSPWVPPVVAGIAHQAMRFAAAERYPSAADMLDAIRPLLPEGWAIEESMFRSLGDADRGHVEPRLVTQPDQPIGRSGRVSLPEPAIAPPPVQLLGGPAQAVPPPVDHVSSSSLQGLGSTATQPPAPAASGARSVMVAASAVIALAVGGAGAYLLMRPHEVAPAPPVGAPPAPPAVAAPPPEVKPRTVRLVVLPADATVEFDGASVTPSDGAVEIRGTIGSVHKVRVTSADGEALRDVAVTEDGPLPTMVQVQAKPGKAPGVAPVAGPLPRPASTGSALPLRQQR